jgi:VWFA-related protein
MMKKIVLLLWFLTLTFQLFAQEQRITIPFSVLDKNEMFFAGLKSSDIQLLKNTDISLELKTNNSLEIVIMIDTSGSQEKVLPFGKQIAEYVVENLLKSGKDKVSIVSFTGKVFVEFGLAGDLKAAKDKIRLITFSPPSGVLGGQAGTPQISDKISIIQGSTSIWESTKEVIKSLSSLPNNNSKRVVIIISDGVNTFGETKRNELTEYAIMTKIPVYTIGIGDDYYGGVDKNAMKKLAEQTGGVAIFPESEKELAKKLIAFESTLRSSYLATFSINSLLAKDKLQEAKIEITNQDLKKQKLVIIQPKGFFLPIQK